MRYLALSMDDGGYVPADADVTWKRRFGDCKGKTTLLLALLKGLGVEAQPALVSTPATATGWTSACPPRQRCSTTCSCAPPCAGRVYWLDGTRLGDRRLDDIETPDMSWTLPVQAAGANLTRLVVPAPERPTSVVNLRLDASKGLDVPAAAHGEMLFRGDQAVALNLRLADLAAAQRDEGLRAYWTGAYSYVTPAKVTATFDPVAREERLAMDGTATLSWDPGTPSGRFLTVDGSNLGWTPDFTRSAGAHADAPFAVAYPALCADPSDRGASSTGRAPGSWVHGAMTSTRRPRPGRAFVRHARLDKGVFTLDALPEESRAGVSGVGGVVPRPRRSRRWPRTQSYVGAPDGYVMTREEIDQYLQGRPWPRPRTI